MITLGIDVGGSTTKIVGVENGEIRSPQWITAADPVSSLFGAFGKYTYDNGISLNDIDHVMLTGAGSAYISSPLYGLPTFRVDEFIANALGARFRSGLERMVVVSMGTGTSFVRVDGDSVTHLGGLEVGGGTLQGLSSLLLKTRDIRKVTALAMKGDLNNVDLHIGDIRVQVDLSPTKPFFEGVSAWASSPVFSLLDHPFGWAFSNPVLWTPTLSAGIQYRLGGEWSIVGGFAPLAFQDTHFVYELLSPYILWSISDGTLGWGLYVMRFSYFF